MNQEQLIKKIPHHELIKALFYSQILFFIISIGLSFFLFEHFLDWAHLFTLNIHQVFYYGVLPGMVIVIIDVVLMYVLPARFFDDGGINQKVFKHSSVVQIFFIALVVAICEEFLFRGVIQTSFGYIPASILFALVHFRYLKKPVLLLSVIFISFYIGYLYHVTGNLLVPIATHFLVDFILGLIIRYQK